MTSPAQGMGRRPQAVGLVLAGEQRAGVAGIGAHGGGRKKGTMQLGGTRGSATPYLTCPQAREVPGVRSSVPQPRVLCQR